LENEFGKGRAVFIACDVTKAEHLKKAFEKVVDTFGGLDILINNAGILNRNWEQVIDLNVKALIRASILAMEHMGKHKGGKGGVIVNISSVAGLSPVYFVPIYSASKCAVLGYSQCLAEMYDKSGVRVVIMCPGSTATPMFATLSDQISDVFRPLLGNIDEEIKKLTTQSTDNVALAMLDLIQKGKNGAAWVSEDGKAPYAVDFPHYSKRSLPV